VLPMLIDFSVESLCHIHSFVYVEHLFSHLNTYKPTLCYSRAHCSELLAQDLHPCHSVGLALREASLSGRADRLILEYIVLRKQNNTDEQEYVQPSPRRTLRPASLKGERKLIAERASGQRRKSSFNLRNTSTRYRLYCLCRSHRPHH